MALKHCLDALGIRADTIVCSGLADALHKCKHEMPHGKCENYEVLFVSTDWVLNNEQEWTSELRKYTPDVHHFPPIVGIVERDQPSKTKACIDLGMSDVISKPFNSAALYESICSLPTNQTRMDREHVQKTSTKPERSFGCFGDLGDFHEGLVLNPGERRFSITSDWLRCIQKSPASKQPSALAPPLCTAPKRKPDFLDFTTPLKLSIQELLPDTWNLAVH